MEFVSVHISEWGCINIVECTEGSSSMDYFPPSKPMNCENKERCSALNIEFADQHESSKSGTQESMPNKNSRLLRENRAAVLIGIFEGLQGDLRVILTKRSMKLSTHPGEVALPGGKVDEEDADDAATALREAKEEIGLDPNLVRVVGTFEPFISLHLLTVVPVVGLVPGMEEFKPVLNADEVDAVFDVPLEMFLKEDYYRCLEREWQGRKYVCHVFDFKTDQGTFVIGGLTASILIRAASIIFHRCPPFTQLLPDFSQLQQTLNAIM